MGFLIRHNIPVVDPYGFFISKYVLPKSDVVHTHGHPHWLDIYKKPKNSQACYIHTVHQIYYKEDSQNKTRWHTEYLLNNRLFDYCHECDVVISVSKWLQQELLESGINSIYIPNGVDFSKCAKADPISFRNKYNIHGDFFLFVGNGSYLKRADLFLMLARRMPDKLFVLCGVGLDYCLNMDNVISLGHLPHDDLLDVIAACKVLVVPSMKETTSLALLEGLASKKIVVATNSSGMKEVMGNCKKYLFTPNDEMDLYEKALSAWDSDFPSGTFYKKLHQNYDIKNIVGKIDRLYEEFIQ
jgi:glycosyltransferase involved in cell wall biosynthesis